MANVKTDQSREDRIVNEVIVDAYTEEEQALGWYYYLESKLKFPFKAKWKSEGAEVEVLEMSSEEDCTEDMFVEVLYTEGTKDVFSVPLSDLEAVATDSTTTEAIADWKYWVNKGYEF